MSHSRLDILIPGLIWPVPDVSSYGQSWPALAALETLLSKGERFELAAKDEETTWLELFGHQHRQGDGCFAAQLMAHHFGLKDERFYLCAAPVHLRADIDKALVFDRSSFELEKDEAEQLAATFNRHFAQDSVTLHVLSAFDWLLEFEQPPQLMTYSLEAVVGRNMHALLPKGNEALRWHGFLNEIQMLFYTHEVNVQRQQRGELPVNGLWLWGNGQGDLAKKSTYQRVWADGVLAESLAGYQAIGYQATLPAIKNLLAEPFDHAALCLPHLKSAAIYGDVVAWLDALQALERAWFGPLSAMLRQRQIKEFRLFSCSGPAWLVTPAALARFWRWRKAFSRHLEVALGGVRP